MIIVDTNVFSELLKAEPAPAVVRWFQRMDDGAIFTTVITQIEIGYGVAILPEGRRRIAAQRFVETLFTERLAGKILPLDNQAADAYVSLAASLKAAGRPLPLNDAYIAAIALANGASIATRNTKDFRGTGVTMIDPFT